ncbi:hypothetical protein HDU83_009753 [Entophlyctis luteolus]|nr:hypothetical protein HDU83_009753 [Entophlyctis luteolus]
MDTSASDPQLLLLQHQLLLDALYPPPANLPAASTSAAYAARKRVKGEEPPLDLATFSFPLVPLHDPPPPLLLSRSAQSQQQKPVDDFVWLNDDADLFCDSSAPDSDNAFPPPTLSDSLFSSLFNSSSAAAVSTAACAGIPALSRGASAEAENIPFDIGNLSMAELEAFVQQQQPLLGPFVKNETDAQDSGINGNQMSSGRSMMQVDESGEESSTSKEDVIADEKSDPEPQPALEPEVKVKRPRGRPRKIRDPADPATSKQSPALKRKPQSPAPLASDETGLQQNQQPQPQPTESDFDDFQYYMSLAEATAASSSTPSGAILAQPSSLLPRPLNVADAQNLSLHTYKPRKAMDRALAQEYLMLRDPAMGPRERRQLRNKLSARSFRDRRKEYIESLESELVEVVREAVDTRSRLSTVELERDEYKAMVQDLEKQLRSLTVLTPTPHLPTTASFSESSAASATAPTQKPLANCRASASSSSSPARMQSNNNNRVVSVHSVSVPMPAMNVRDLLEWPTTNTVVQPSPHPPRGKLFFDYSVIEPAHSHISSLPQSVAVDDDFDECETLCGGDDERTDQEDSRIEAESLLLIDSSTISEAGNGDDDESIRGDDIDTLAEGVVSVESAGGILEVLRDEALWRLLQNLDLRMSPALVAKGMD